MQKHRIAEFNIARKKASMQAVDAFMKANAYASAKDCSQALGMNYGSVCRYIKELKAQNEILQRALNGKCKKKNEGQ